MKIFRSLTIWFGVVFTSGCAVIPPETVKLSSTMGQQMGEIKKSHTSYLNTLYDRLEAQANLAVDHVYAPRLISTALNGGSGKVLFQKLDAGKKGGADAEDAIVFTTRFLKLVRDAVEVEREAAVKPIREARTRALTNMEAAWTQVLQGNSTLTAYLTSLVKIRESQDQLFAAIGLPDIQDKVSDSLSNASDKIGAVLAKAKDKDAKLDELHKEIESILNSIKSK